VTDNFCTILIIIDVRLCHFDSCTIIILYYYIWRLLTAQRAALPAKSYDFPRALCRRECRLRFLPSYFVRISLTAQRTLRLWHISGYSRVYIIILHNATVVVLLLSQYDSVGVHCDPKRIQANNTCIGFTTTVVVVFMRFDLFPVQMTLGHVSLMEATVARSMVSRRNGVKQCKVYYNNNNNNNNMWTVEINVEKCGPAGCATLYILSDSLTSAQTSGVLFYYKFQNSDKSPEFIRKRFRVQSGLLRGSSRMRTTALRIYYTLYFIIFIRLNSPTILSARFCMKHTRNFTFWQKIWQNNTLLSAKWKWFP